MFVEIGYLSGKSGHGYKMAVPKPVAREAASTTLFFNTHFIFESSERRFLI